LFGLITGIKQGSTTNLVHDDEEGAVREEGPDKDVGEDARDQAVRVVHHDGAVPVDGDERPGQGSRHGRGMDEARVGVVAEVEGREVDEVEDEEDLGPDEVLVDEEPDEAEVEEVVDDEMAAHGAGGVDRVDVAGEEVADVAGLEDEDGEPGYF